MPGADRRAGDVPYAAVAEAFDRRSRALSAAAWLARFRALIPAGAPVLDLGCGAGEPIARPLIEAGHPLTGIDIAAPMLAIARSRFPGQTWIEADMRRLDLGRRFAGIIA
ncbi:hypothetical protein BH23PSE1_BH23PSE1_19520 [soil metagenome]